MTAVCLEILTIKSNKMTKFIDIIKEGNEGNSFRDIVDNLDEDQFEDAAEAYHQSKLKLLNIPPVIESLDELIEWCFNTCNTFNSEELHEILDKINAR